MHAFPPELILHPLTCEQKSASQKFGNITIFDVFAHQGFIYFI